MAKYIRRYQILQGRSSLVTRKNRPQQGVSSLIPARQVFYFTHSGSPISAVPTANWDENDSDGIKAAIYQRKDYDYVGNKAAVFTVPSGYSSFSCLNRLYVSQAQFPYTSHSNTPFSGVLRVRERYLYEDCYTKLIINSLDSTGGFYQTLYSGVTTNEYPMFSTSTRRISGLLNGIVPSGGRIGFEIGVISYAQDPSGVQVSGIQQFGLSSFQQELPFIEDTGTVGYCWLEINEQLGA